MRHEQLENTRQKRRKRYAASRHRIYVGALRPLPRAGPQDKLKLRPTKREEGASRRLFTQRFRAGLSYAAPLALVGWWDVGRAVSWHKYSGRHTYSGAKLRLNPDPSKTEGSGTRKN